MNWLFKVIASLPSVVVAAVFFVSYVGMIDVVGEVADTSVPDLLVALAYMAGFMGLVSLWPVAILNQFHQDRIKKIQWTNWCFISAYVAFIVLAMLVLIARTFDQYTFLTEQNIVSTISISILCIYFVGAWRFSDFLGDMERKRGIGAGLLGDVRFLMTIAAVLLLGVGVFWLRRRISELI